MHTPTSARTLCLNGAHIHDRADNGNFSDYFFAFAISFHSKSHVDISFNPSNVFTYCIGNGIDMSHLRMSHWISNHIFTRSSSHLHHHLSSSSHSSSRVASDERRNHHTQLSRHLSPQRNCHFHCPFYGQIAFLAATSDIIKFQTHLLAFSHYSNLSSLLLFFIFSFPVLFTSLHS